MGLELVELVMDVEDDFGIRLDDRDLDGKPALTVGAFYEVVLRTIRADPASPWARRLDLESVVWRHITGSAAKHAYPDIKPEQITADTRFIEDLGFG